MFALASPSPGQPQQKRGDPFLGPWWIAVIHSGCFLPFLRTGFGHEANGVRGVLSFVLLLVCIGFEPLMQWWAAAFLVALLVQKFITWRATRNGAVIHSLSAGPPLMMKLPFVKQERTAMFIEMMLCFVLGALFLAVSQFMGVFIMLGFVSLMVRAGIEETVFNRRITRMRDARIEARWYGDRMM